jgi:hypothetical protein
MTVSEGTTLVSPDQRNMVFPGGFFMQRATRHVAKRHEKERYYKTGRGRDELDQLY